MRIRQRRRWLQAAFVVFMLVLPLGAQLAEPSIDRGAAEESHESFFGQTLWLIVGVPFLVLMIIGIANRKPKQTVREFGADDFERDVLGVPGPMLIHLYREWSIGDRVMIAQVERLATTGRGLFGVGFLNIDRHPFILERFPHVNPPALLLFMNGRRVFHCEGVFDEAEIFQEVQDVIRRESRSEPPSREATV